MVTEINLTPTASYLDIACPATSPGAAATKLPARTWGTPKDCVAGAVLVHGLGAHSGWFEALGRRLKVRRIFALAYDQVGFGKRRQEKFCSKEQWFNDLSTAFAHARQMVGDKPIFIMGNSMGAAVSLKVVADGNIAPSGLIMFSPGFDGHPSTFRTTYRVSALLRACLKPDSDIDLPYTPDMVTRTEAVRAWLTNDPDRRFTPSGRMLIGVLKLSFDIAKVKAINCPALMLTAGIDNIVDGKVSSRIFERLSAPRKDKRVFDEAWHDLMFDPVIEELSDQVADWIKTISQESRSR